MNVTVFGAAGKIGRLVVAQLLAQGHEVTAVVRDRSTPETGAARPAVVEANLSDESRLRAAIAGRDAIISALGPPLKRSTGGTPLTDGTALIVRIMREEGVLRFIGLATPSIPDPRDKPHWKHKILPVIAGLAFPGALAEIRGMTAAVTTAPDLDWTIVRITNPTDKAPTGRIRSGFLGHTPIGSAMSRSDIAAFLTSQLNDTRYLNTAPAVSN